MNFLRQYPEKDHVVKRPEAVGDISLDKPVRPLPGVNHLAERGVAAPAGAEPVGAAGELRLVLRLKQQAHHLSD